MKHKESNMSTEKMILYAVLLAIIVFIVYAWSSPRAYRLDKTNNYPPTLI